MTARVTLDEHHAELRERVAEASERLNVPGVAVGIYLGGEEYYVCHGVTSIANPLPVDADTIFQIGSTAKTYTGTAMMVLVERGLVDLHAPVRRYIPELRLQDEDVAASVTVLHLLNHTAGWAGDFIVDTGYGDDALERFVERLAEAPQERPLGATVAYNNAAICLAGRVIEKVSGKPFEAALQELVLGPLGLSAHAYFPWDVMTRRFAIGHSLKNDALRIARWYGGRSAHPAGSSLAATARDQIRYARFHLGDGWGVLRRSTLDQMQAKTTPDPGSAGFGITWELREINGVPIVFHGGSTLGQQSAFELVPERDFAFIALSNARHGHGLNTELMNWVFDAYLGIVEPEREPEPAPEPLLLSASDLAAYAGRFEAYTGTLDVEVDGDQLIGTFTISPALVAALLEPGEEWPADPPFPFKILPNDEFYVFDGPMKGTRGPLQRDASGRVSAYDLGRRVMKRRE